MIESGIKMKRVLFTKFGSHIYGTNTPKSDTDLKGIFVPSAREILLCRAPKNIRETTKIDKSAKNTSEDIDVEMFALHNYLHQLMEGQTFALDMLFTPKSFHLESTEEWSLIQENRAHFIHKNVKPFFGYARQQAAKYGVKGSRVSVVKAMLDVLKQLPAQSKLRQHEDLLRETARQVNGEFIDRMNGRDLVSFEVSPHEKDKGMIYLSVCDRLMPFTNKVIDAVQVLQRLDDNYGNRARMAASNEGIDWKALSHAVRVGEEAIELLKTGEIQFPRPNAEFLLKIKLGEFAYAPVAEYIENVFERLLVAETESTLPAEPNRAKADEIIELLYGHAVLHGQL